MAYTALYRKFRPKNFSDVIGQEHIIRTLTNQVKSDRISHAYLFCGTRGTGKTSTAKIFARVINCENIVDGEPCNTCKSCVNILDNISANVMEIDAASNNGVDSIREIREGVKYAPSTGTFKVFIIDEAHMLSTAAFNALLKTLEEPPDHVVFILATTDPSKVPITILSRCQRYDFKRISSTNMLETIREYVEQEKINISEDGLRYIISLADGAMRDALSVLDQTSGLYLDEEITLEKIQELLGAVDTKIYTRWVTALNGFNGSEILKIINEIVASGRDINQFTGDLIKYLRNMLYIKTADMSYSELDMSVDAYSEIKNQSNSTDANTIINYINVFSEFQSQLRYADNPSILLEVVGIKLCNPQSQANTQNNGNAGNTVSNEGLTALLDRINELEKSLEGKVIASSNTEITDNTKNNNSTKEAYEPPTKKPEREAPTPKHMEEIIKNWNNFIKEFTSGKSNYSNSMLAKSTAKYAGGDVIYVIVANAPAVDYLKKNFVGKLEEAVANKYNIEISINYVDKASSNNLKVDTSLVSTATKPSKPKEEVKVDIDEHFEFDQIEEE